MHSRFSSVHCKICCRGRILHPRQGLIAIDDYENVDKGLKAYFEYNILLDPDEVNHTLYKMVSREIIEAEDKRKPLSDDALKGLLAEKG